MDDSSEAHLNFQSGGLAHAATLWACCLRCVHRLYRLPGSGPAIGGVFYSCYKLLGLPAVKCDISWW